jgi:hypothetical protein
MMNSYESQVNSRSQVGVCPHHMSTMYKYDECPHCASMMYVCIGMMKMLSIIVGFILLVGTLQVCGLPLFDFRWFRSSL